MLKRVYHVCCSPEERFRGTIVINQTQTLDDIEKMMCTPLHRAGASRLPQTNQPEVNVES